MSSDIPKSLFCQVCSTYTDQTRGNGWDIRTYRCRCETVSLFFEGENFFAYRLYDAGRLGYLYSSVARPDVQVSKSETRFIPTSGGESVSYDTPHVSLILNRDVIDLPAMYARFRTLSTFQ